MIRYNLVPRDTTPVYHELAHQPIPQLRPVQVDENYFDRLAAFGLACLIAAIVGKLVMSSLYR